MVSRYKAYDSFGRNTQTRSRAFSLFVFLFSVPPEQGPSLILVDHSLNLRVHPTQRPALVVELSDSWQCVCSV